MTLRGIIEFNALPTSRQIANDTSYALIEDSPLDGFSIPLFSDQGNRWVSQELWGIDGGGVRKWVVDDFKNFISDLQKRAIRGWGKTKYNYLILQVPAKTIDWFDTANIELVKNNLKLLGKIVKECDLYGIFMDPEPYGVNTWKYSSQPNYTSYTYAQYNAQVKDVAREVAQSWLNDVPDLVVFNIKQYYWYIAELGLGDANSYGLLPAFLDGLYEVFGRHKHSHNIFGDQKRTGFKRQERNSGIIAATGQSYRIEDQGELNGFYSQLSGEAYQGNSGYFNAATTEYSLGHWPDMAASEPYEIGFNNDNPLDPLNNWTPTRSKTALGNLVTAKADWIWFFTITYHMFQGMFGGVLHQDYITKYNEFRSEQGLPT